MTYRPLCLAAGYIFGVWLGFFIQSMANLLAAIPIFFVGRYVIKNWLESKLKHHHIYGRIQHATREWRGAAKLSLLMCFVPLT